MSVDDDVRRAGAPRGDHDQRADRAAAGDQHALAEQRPGPAHGVQRTDSGSAIAPRRRSAVATSLRLRRLDHDLLAERALHVRRAHGAAVVAHVQAMVLQPLLAVAAQAAGPARADGDAVAGLQAARRRRRPPR